MNLPPIRWPDGLDTRRFLQEFWQKKPLLLRQAFAGFDTPLPPDEVAGLALEPDVSSRLIVEVQAGRFRVEHGPFDEARLGGLGDTGWSLLVTDVEKVLPELATCLAPFSFLPTWRLDDLMISVAPDGASVGAHVDQYDVFLLQASGRRCWSIESTARALSSTHPLQRSCTEPHPDSAADADAGTVPEVEAEVEQDLLDTLSDFQSEHDWVLEPGDLLYLPPGIAHHGVAVGEHCTTWSIGFRAPTSHDVLQHFCDELASIHPRIRFADSKLEPARCGEIAPPVIETFLEIWRAATRLDATEARQLVGSLVTRPEFADPDDHVRIAWIDREHKQTDERVFTSSAALDRVDLFVNGQRFDCSRRLAEALSARRFGVVDLPLDLVKALDADERRLIKELVNEGVLDDPLHHADEQSPSRDA